MLYILYRSILSREDRTMNEIKVTLNKVFAPAHTTDKRYVVMKGSAGSGKSADCGRFYPLRLLQQPGRNLLCVRKADVSNANSTFNELVSAIENMGLSDYFKITTSPKLKIQCVNGNCIMFAGMLNEKERDRIRSITAPHGKITDIWMEEATEFTRSDFEILDDRLRGKLDKGLFYQFRLTFNPVSASNWIKREFFDFTDDDTILVNSTYLDNIFTDEAFIKRQNRRRLRDPKGYKVYGLGEWGETEGLILQTWEVKDFSLDYDNFDMIRIGQDFGYNHANVILTIGFYDDDIYILDELYCKGMTTQRIIEIADGRVPKDVPMWCDSANPDKIQEWYDAGWNADKVNKGGSQGSVDAQIDFLQSKRIYIHPRCVKTREEISHWQYLKDPRDEERYLDKPREIDDDTMAALRYAVEDARKPPSEWGTADGYNF